jgi:hypothetical protein
MSSAKYSIDVDPARDLVRVSLSGFFTAEDIDRFQAELQIEHRKLGCDKRGGPLTINDLTEMAIQSQDVLARWGEFLANPTHRSRRLALVVASALGRMQLQRIIGDRNAQVFTDVREAEQWLFADSAA